jgi:tRNA threonylcarbamoyladenosine biosynthesis protein TsaE
VSETAAVVTADEAATRVLAAELAGRLRPGDVVALHGPLGAGKTCFVRGLAEGLGLDPDDVSSPTFVLWHEYAVVGRTALVHIDAYRVADGEELVALGLEERLEAADAIIAIEWAERVESILPAATVHVRLEHGVDSRHIAITLPG